MIHGVSYMIGKTRHFVVFDAETGDRWHIFDDSKKRLYKDVVADGVNRMMGFKAVTERTLMGWLRRNIPLSKSVRLK